MPRNLRQPADTGMERASTDAGRLGDKVAAQDPAAAPLETDAEASAHTTSKDAAAASLARHQDIANQSGTPRQGPFGARLQPRRRPSRGWLLAVFTTVLVVAGVAAGLVSLS